MPGETVERLYEENQQMKRALEKCCALYSEVDCRVGHGVESGGHLEYVREKLLDILEGLDYWPGGPAQTGFQGIPIRTAPQGRTGIPENDLHKCDNCTGEFYTPQLNPIQDYDQRVEPGGMTPSGECPNCHALCYPRGAYFADEGE